MYLAVLMERIGIGVYTCSTCAVYFLYKIDRDERQLMFAKQSH